jgi:hypothetical protein
MRSAILLRCQQPQAVKASSPHARAIEGFGLTLKFASRSGSAADSTSEAPRTTRTFKRREHASK